MKARAWPGARRALVLAAALPSSPGGPLPRPVAHGASGWLDELLIVVLLVAVVGAIWLFVQSGGDGAADESGEPPEA